MESNEIPNGNERSHVDLRQVQSEGDLLNRLMENSTMKFREVLNPADFDSIMSMVRAFVENDPVLQGRLNWLGGFLGSLEQDQK